MKEIPLTQGKVALVDDGDFERVVAAGPWHAKFARGHWYAVRNAPSEGKWYSYTQGMHRFILGWNTEMSDRLTIVTV